MENARSQTAPTVVRGQLPRNPEADWDGRLLLSETATGQENSRVYITVCLSLSGTARRTETRCSERKTRSRARQTSYSAGYTSSSSTNEVRMPPIIGAAI